MKCLGLVTLALVMTVAAAAAQPAAAPGWITATNQNCKIWNPEPQPNESVTWSGGCVSGLASGKGVLRWTENGQPDVEFDGEYAKGKRNGAGVVITPDGEREQGVWVDDELQTSPGNSI